MEDCESAAQYISIITNAATKLADLGLVAGDEWVAAMLMAGLPPSYTPLVLSLEARNDVTSQLVKTQIFQARAWLPGPSEAGTALLTYQGGRPNRYLKSKFRGS